MPEPPAHPCERRAAPRVVQDLAHHALDVAVPLGRIERAMPRGALPVRGVGREYAPAPLALGADDAAHLRARNKSWSLRRGCKPTTCQAGLASLTSRSASCCCATPASGRLWQA